MKKQPYYSPQVQDRAVRLVFSSKHDPPSRWAATQSVASKIGCTAETLRKWIRRSQLDQGIRPDVTSDQPGAIQSGNIRAK